MAFTVSRTRIAPVMVKTETTYGSDAAPVDGTDDLLTINSPNPMRADFSRFEIRPHGASFTRKLDIIGQRVMMRPFTTLMSGSGSAGVSAVNGYKALSAVMLAGGHRNTVVAVTSLTYAPATIAQLTTFSGSSPECGAATIWSELGGYAHKTTGCWGNIRLNANPTQAMLMEFSGIGIYAAPAATTGSEWNAFTGGTNRAVPFLNVGGTITPSGGSAYTMVFKSFSFDAGCDIQRVSDANSTTGLHSLLFADRNPTGTAVIALDTDTGSNLTYANIYANITASTTHLLEFALPGGTGNNVQHNYNQAQLVDVVPGEENGHRTLALSYKFTHATTNEGEYDWAVT